MPAPEPQTLEHVENELRELTFTTFTHEDAWRLGCLLVEMATEREHPVAIDVRRGHQQVFHAALEGSTPDNDSWIVRKVRVVERFGAASYVMNLRAQARGVSFTEWQQLPWQEYAAAGGAVPVVVEGVGPVGVVTVSGLRQEEDHALVVEAMRIHMAGEQD
ncbi:uncharacterized protein (UPF0303 family) [Sediminihabitans luteus]|uniref:UPF0303 protein CLV28_1370 n=1 Tax=Sediminihabitans luteus TaxID=1138585 RepID=A0A2M9CPR6_9CELL|nr:heme-degrading domain-containing protein [Sediminihabitans luteus]PJJ73886.1 uncharacterized protein (UPF0303 family) [Sediminihabitans luteus]GII98202.1 UPF0303 protein [Sediminihabitans luteus]